MENEDLIALIQSGIDPRGNIEQLYSQNTGFIYGIAQKYSAYSEMDDLMQEGFIALHEAAGRYSPEKESSFLTFFSYVLRSRFRRYVDSTGKVKRIPEFMRDRINRYKSFMSESAAAGKEPTDPEICRVLEISGEQLEHLRKVMYEDDLLSIDSTIPGTDLSVGESVADPSDVEAEAVERVAAEQIKSELWEIVDELEGDQADILVDRYKLSQTLKEIGQKRGISVDKVRQIEDKALKILSQKRRIRELAEESGIYSTSKAFRGSVGSFRRHGSITEYAAIKEMESDERIDSIRKELASVKNDLKGIISQLNDDA